MIFFILQTKRGQYIFRVRNNEMLTSFWLWVVAPRSATRLNRAHVSSHSSAPVPPLTCFSHLLLFPPTISPSVSISFPSRTWRPGTFSSRGTRCLTETRRGARHPWSLLPLRARCCCWMESTGSTWEPWRFCPGASAIIEMLYYFIHHYSMFYLLYSVLYLIIIIIVE